MSIHLLSFAIAWAITPAFFWAGLGLISLPILIHILNRRRFKVVQWAAMDYLLQAMRKNRRRLKFEQWLLLATRCLLLALLGLALARPYGCDSGAIAGMAAGRSGLHVIVIDNSYSMAYEAERPNSRTHLEQAKLLARQRVDALTAGNESVILMTAARPATAVIARPSYNLDDVKAAIDRVEQTYAATDIPGALQMAMQLANEVESQPNRFLYLMTDTARSAWQPRAELIKQVGQQLPATFGSRVYINDLSLPDQWNHAVRSIRGDSNVITTRFRHDFLADVKGYGGNSEAHLQWMLNDNVLPEGGRIRPDVDTEPQRQTRAVFREGGPHVMTVTLQGEDRLKADNTHWRVMEVASELPVLIVEGQRGGPGGALSGSGTSLDMALAPRKEVGPLGQVRTDSYVAPELISDMELGNRIIGEYRALIFANVAAPREEHVRQIEAYVRAGGTLMIFMGDLVNVDIYNQFLTSRGLLPGRLITRRSGPSGFTFDFRPHGAMHPVLEIFRGEERSGLDTTQIHTYMQLDVDAESEAQVVLQYREGERQTGDPAILVHRLGNGRVVTVTTTANADWNNLPVKNAYVPLMHELLRGTVDVGDRWMNRTIGQMLELPQALRLTATPLLTAPDRRQIPVDLVTLETGQSVYRSPPLTRPGIYELVVGTRTVPIAVNVPAEEADIRPLPPAAIRSALGDIEVQQFGDSLPTAGMRRDDSLDLGWILMLAVLGLVAVECFMAMHFGHYRRAGGVKTEGAKA